MRAWLRAFWLLGRRIGNFREVKGSYEHVGVGRMVGLMEGG